MHGSISAIGRTSSRSAVGAAAYRSAARYIDLRTGATYDCTKKDDVLESGVVGWGGSAESLWNAAEDAEPMAEAIVAREAVWRVPATLDVQQSLQLCRTYAGTLRCRYGVAVHWAIHAKAPADVMAPSGVLALVGMTVRTVTGNRFGPAVRGLNDARHGRSTLLELRHIWVDAVMVVLRTRTPGPISATDPAPGSGHLDLLARERAHLSERRRPPLPERRSAVERALAWRRRWIRRDQHKKPDQPH
jgi:hypothetical protein